MLAKPNFLLLNSTLFSSARWGRVWFTQHAPRKVVFFKKKNQTYMSWIVRSNWLKHPLIGIMHRLYCLKTAGKNLGLRKTAYKIRHISWTLFWTLKIARPLCRTCRNAKLTFFLYFLKVLWQKALNIGKCRTLAQFIGPYRTGLKK